MSLSEYFQKFMENVTLFCKLYHKLIVYRFFQHLKMTITNASSSGKRIKVVSLISVVGLLYDFFGDLMTGLWTQLAMSLIIPLDQPGRPEP